MGSEKYNREEMKREAENLQSYLDIVTELIVITGITQKQYDKAVSKVKELIKLLKKGKGDEVYDKERYFEYQAEKMENEDSHKYSMYSEGDGEIFFDDGTSPYINALIESSKRHKKD